MNIEKHVLVGDHVSTRYIDCPKRGGAVTGPDTIIIHYTGGNGAESTADYLCSSSVKASAHLVIDRNSLQTFQLIPFDTVAWHAGLSGYTFPDGCERSGFNQYSIGIELDNAGPLVKTGSGYMAWFGKSYQEEEIYFGIHQHQTEPKYWHAYSECQIGLLLEVCCLLLATYPIKHILGHDDISPRRKIDPGPAFPMEQFSKHLLDLDRNQDGPELDSEQSGRVTSPGLNVRSGPSARYSTVADPLEYNQALTILEEREGWYRIRASIELEGWVSSRHVELRREM